MPRLLRRSLPVLLCTLAPVALVAAEKTSKTASQDDQKDVLAGHSHHGEAFNEGPRQKAYLMKGTGNVTFPVTTSSPLAQRFINQGIGQLHGFWYFEAERSFRQAAALDPDCAMAYWGMAFANKGNTKRAKGFIAKAVERKANATDREVMYIDALETMINSKGSYRGKKGRVLAADFGDIAKKYPHDIEAKAFQGLFQYYTRNKKPRLKHEDIDKLLREVLAVNPLHPVHHYIIHLWDYKDPKRALSSAAVCGQSAPAIAHMWHMPGHTYSRLKRYRDAVWQQEASARTDHAHMIRDRVMPDQIHNFAHNNEWLTRNLINVGRMHDAVDLAKNMIELPRHPKYNTLAKRGSSYYGRLRLFQVLYEFELWDELIRLCETPYLEPSDRHGEQVKRLRYLGRAHFAKGDLKNGEAVIAKLEARLKKLEAVKLNALQQAEADVRQQGGPVVALKPGQRPVKKPVSRRAAAALRKKIAKAKSEAGKAFVSKLRSLDKALQELKGRRDYAEGDYDKGLNAISNAGGISAMDKARLQLKARLYDDAEKTLRNHVKKNENEVLPLAHLVEVLWLVGQQGEAKKAFTKLRTVAGEADLDAPVLARLAPLAAEFNWPKDWRTPAPRPKDFGPRPNLKELGPFRWHPFKTADWKLKDVDGKVHSLSDYRGKPVIVIFYLGFGCLHCAEQLQAFAPKTEEFRKAGYSLIAISTDDMSQLKQSHENYRKGKFPFPLVSDAKLNVFKKYRVFDDFEGLALHGTFVIDAHGYVRWQDISYEPFMEPDFVLNEAQRLLEQTSEPTAIENDSLNGTRTGDAGKSAETGMPAAR